MKLRILIAAILFLVMNQLFSQEPVESNKMKSDEKIYSSSLGGFSGTFPIVSPVKMKKYLIREVELINELEALRNEKYHSLGQLREIEKVDTISIRKHMSFLGGVWTLPKLSKEEKVRKKENNRIKREKQKLTKRLVKIDSKEKVLTIKRDRIDKLRIDNEMYVEKRIFWGFASWQVEKESLENQLNTENNSILKL